MSYKIEFSIASSKQIEQALCSRLEKIRLTNNITQSQLAEEAGVSTKTIYRMEKGDGVSLDTFIRILMALGIQHNLEVLLPDPTIRPIERIDQHTENRKRARQRQSTTNKKIWTWGEDNE